MVRICLLVRGSSRKARDRNMAKRRSKPKVEHEVLSLEVESFSASVDAGVDFRLRDPRYRREDAHIYRHTSQLEIECKSLSPKSRAGVTYRVTVYGEDPSEARFSLKVGDCKARGEDGRPLYDKKRGQLTPVYNIPHGIGFLQKDRGATDWSAAAWVSADNATQMLTLLMSARPLYVSLEERKEGRYRAIVNFSLQTTHPDEE